MGYAEKLGLLFAYSSNGHGFEEWDFTTNTQRSLGVDEMPTPEALWERFSAFRALDAHRLVNPLLHPYWRHPTGKKLMRYYQEISVNRAIEAILKGQTSKATLDFIRERRERLIVYQLPSYSPDYNPIDPLWKKFKVRATHHRFFAVFAQLVEVVEALTYIGTVIDEILCLMGIYTKPVLSPTAA